MQTSQVLKAGLNTEWAVIPPWTRPHKSPTITNTSNAVKATLVSAEHYFKAQAVSKDASWFRITTDKNFGLLVKLLSRAGEEVFAIIPASNFIASWSDYDTYWVEENLRIAERRKVYEAEQEALQEKRRVRSEIERKVSASSTEVAERMVESIEQTLTDLLGTRYLNAKLTGNTSVSTRIKGEWRNLDTDKEEFAVLQTGTISMDLQLFQRLLEKAVNN